MDNLANIEGMNIQEFLESVSSRQSKIIEDEAKFIQQKDEEWEQMMAYTSDQMTEYMEQELTSTEILVEGISYATQMSEGSSLLLAGLIRMRETTEASIAWIKSCAEEGKNSKSAPKSKKPETTAVAAGTPQATKRTTPKKAISEEDDL